eukprot:jgi/Botrbrau1/15214/Bobra.0149s0069.1
MKASGDIVAALRENKEEDVKSIWQQASVTEAERARAVYFAMWWARDHITAWIFNRPEFPMAAVLSLIEQQETSPTFDRLLLFRRQASCPSEALLRAAISKRVPFGSMGKLFERLLEAGGQALALQAMDLGYPLQFPSFWLDPSFVTRFVNKSFVAAFAARGLPTQGLTMALAVHTKDLQLLRDSTTAHSSPHCHESLGLALREGWLCGAELLIKRYKPSPNTHLLEAAMESSNLASLDLLLRQGKVWKEAAFALAFVTGNFAVLEHAVKNRCLPRRGKPMLKLSAVWRSCSLFGHIPVGSEARAAPAEWAADLRNMIGNSECLKECPLRQRTTASAQQTACVAALIDAEVAQLLSNELETWRAGVYSLFHWWATRSRANEDKHGLAGSSYIPFVLENIMEQACIVPPWIWSRARAVAVEICLWMMLPGLVCPVITPGGSINKRLQAAAAARGPRMALTNAAPGMSSSNDSARSLRKRKRVTDM